MTDGDVDARHALALLGNDGVDGDSRLAGLAVTNDEFALATANRHHGVDGLETGLQGLIDRFTGDHPGATFSITSVILALMGPLPSMG